MSGPVFLTPGAASMTIVVGSNHPGTAAILRALDSHAWGVKPRLHQAPFWARDWRKRR